MSNARSSPPSFLRIVLGLACVSQGLGCGGTGGDERPRERSPFATAESLRIEGRYAEAIPHYRAVHDSFLLAGDSAGLWQARLRWTGALMDMGKHDSAWSLLARASELATDNTRREAWIHLVTSGLLDREGDLDAALAEATRALELSRAAGDRMLEWNTYVSLGRLYGLMGRNREALAAHEQYLSLAGELGPPAGVAQGLHNVALFHQKLGRLADAVRFYEEALAIYRRIGNPQGIAVVTSNLGVLHRDIGSLEKALGLFRESLRYGEQIGELSRLGVTHVQVANLYQQVGNHEAARQHLERALEINRGAGRVYGLALTFESLGRLELEGGRLRPARDALTSALSLADSAGFSPQRASIHEALARLAVAQVETDAALRWANASLAIADSLENPDAQYHGLQARGMALELAGSPMAVEVYTSAIRLLESWRGRLALGDLRMGISEPHLDAHEGAIRILVGQGRAAEAFDVAEGARARLLLELMARDRTQPETVSPEDTLQDRLRELYAGWAKASASQRAGIDREITKLIEALALLGAQARRQDPVGGNARYPVPVTLPDIQAGLIRPGRGLLAYFWGDDHVYGWWISGKSAKVARLGPADSLRTVIGFLRAALEEDPTSGVDWRTAARNAFQKLVAPLALTPVTEIVVIPDGPLAHIPLEVLVPGDGQRPWGATLPITYGPSASILLALANAPRGGGWQRQLLAVGDPAVVRVTPQVEETRADADDVLAPLPYAAEEARAVHRLFRGGGADLLLGKRATPERWSRFDPGRYRYLHFAAHARVSDRRPESTHLVLAGGRLDLAAIRQLRLSAELVTLSACETGLGRRVRGEGVIGLPHAFLAAGARGVIVTLWRVGDRSAADFMREFYWKLQEGQAPAEALLDVRRAHLAREGAAAHPSRWAPFVLVGALQG